ncbi:MAG TPA: hypothetical protein PKE39_11535 [Ignavibacteria bacterium]|nr:hypothetical protein [Ignavibacteria bacterium]HMQ99646.1 hypothetical protein [Ignavibacteria bacterium]
MKKFTKKILGFFLPFLFIMISFNVFTGKVNADPEYRIERVCSNGICVVTVYTLDGAIVNVYEELDSNP